jgi:hypothetical protein
MRLVTVAEYVETDEIRMRIAKLGVDYGQGFAIARPVPLDEVLAELPIIVAAEAITTVAQTLDVPLPVEIVLQLDDDEPARARGGSL